MAEQRTSSTPSSIATTTATTPIASMANTIRSPGPLPQVQVIPQTMHSPPYLAQFPYNQQLMLQNAAVAAMAQQQLNMTAMMQGRPPSVSPTSPGMMSPSMMSQQQQQQQQGNIATSTHSNSNSGSKQNNGKQNQIQQGQATPMIGGKPAVMPTQQAQPLVLSQLGAVFGQNAANQALVAQSKGQVQGQPQLITTQAPLRFSQPQLVTNTGQIIQSGPLLTNQAVLQAMANLQQGIPLAAHQPLLTGHGQPPTIMAGQSVYIRTNGPIQPQGMMANMQFLQQYPGMGESAVNQLPYMQAVAGMKPNKIELPHNSQVKTGGSKTPSGKTLLPSKSSAKVQPTKMGQSAKLNIPQVIPKQKSRSKSSSKTSASVPTAATHPVQKQAPNPVKVVTPVVQSNITVPAAKSQSDSETETAKANREEPETEPSSKSLDVSMDTVTTEETKESGVESEVKEGKEEVAAEEEPMEEVAPSKPVLLPEQTPVVEKQRAIVKPHILTHIIEGFIIQEGSEPFPVQRSSLLTEYVPPKPSRTDRESDEDMPDLSYDPPPPVLEPEGFAPPAPLMLTCEYCGNQERASKFRRSKRFCSIMCAKRYNVACSKRSTMFRGGENKVLTGKVTKFVRKRKHVVGNRKGWRSERGGRLSYNINMPDPSGTMQQPHGEDFSSSNSGQEESSSSPTSPAQHPNFEMSSMESSTDPAKWTVSEVYEFINSLPGCASYADEFRSQEIDGQALLLLKEDHLMSAMNIKLGPALKICAKITSIKDEFV
ncbi:polyhomeotic-like protein 2 isoform X2 [Gigantopelta aegis]|uniref:polyhomeotic-like protein 2 isoform X2 n=1 Tax=Gigantopelta aegis TaxID=1735272 RepID=UPI001B88CA61|nr:polyhomeotic-like protein 2 isoform X2 [Gigantopelta aegis]